MSRSRRCFQRAGSVSSWPPPPPVGRGSWGLMPLAARHNAISRTRGVLRWVSGAAQTGLPSLWQAWPPVAVSDPVGGGESESAVVAAGNDHISDTGLVAVGQTHLRRGWGVVEAMITGSSIHVGDKLPGGGDHDRVQSGRSIEDPSGEGILAGLGHVADVDSAVIEIEVECVWFAFTEGE